MKTKLLKIRLTFSVTMLFLLLIVVGMTKAFAQGNVPIGAINGRFSVSENQQVYFAKGNLQYNAMAHSWRFAENQYDHVGEANNNISSEYNGWIDLFGWGTSGYNHGAVCYQPWSTATNQTYYWAYGEETANLNDYTGQADWGYNQISNGGNVLNQWRTLTTEEWQYIFWERATTSGIRFAKATVNEVQGLILLPDNWNTDTYTLNNTNDGGFPFDSNIITEIQWLTLENAGAIFLPVAGRRFGTEFSYNGGDGCYWSASYRAESPNNAYALAFWSNSLHPNYSLTRGFGFSVRLVCSAPSISYGINATPNPSDGGTIMGAGTYQAGETCTLTATANEGYTFINWTENSEVVSTEAEYTFTVTTDRNLVANFKLITNHWTPESSGYSDNMALTGVIFIDGVEQRNDALEVGVFCGEECRGAQMATYFQPTDRYLVMLMVYGNSGDNLTFKIYDHISEQELDLNSPSSIMFNTDGYGTLVEPYFLNFTMPGLTHTRAMVSGWNWYSTYIELNSINGLEMLENSLGGAGIRIQGRNGYADMYEYQGSYSWYGTLNGITNEQMYKIRTNAACDAVMIGNVASAANHPITINSGWNWIGYPVNQSVSVTNAMSGFTPTGNDVIKGRNGYTTYIDYSGYTMWYGTLNNLEPGQGYMYQSFSSSPKTLVFQTGKGEDAVENNNSENMIFSSESSDFSDNMNITAVIDIDGEELRSEDYELAAFIDGECRGSVKLMYVEPIDRYVAFLTVFGENSENINFVLTDGNDTRWSESQIVYTSDAVVGTPIEPATISFGTLGLNDNELADAVVYPNPTKDVFNIQCEGIRKVEVLNVYGQVVISKEANTDNIQIDLGDNAAGAYMLRIYTSNGMVIRNLVKNN